MTWLIIILGFGTLIVILESTLESIAVRLERRDILKIPTAEWFSNETLQLQRMAHEELGLGDWEGCTRPGAVPITKNGQFLGTLNNDAKHPRLVNLAAVPKTQIDEEIDYSTGQDARTSRSKTEGDQSTD